MARKKKSWREIDDPADIFGSDRVPEIDASIHDPAYVAFRRHIDEHIQAETKAFHDLRSTAEHELQAAPVLASPPRRTEARTIPSLPPATRMPVEVKTKGLGVGTVAMLSVIFAAIGFLLHGVWQQTQPTTRKSNLAAAKPCVSEKPLAAKKAPVKTAEVAPAFAPVPVEVPPVPVPPPVQPAAPTPSIEVTAVVESTLKGMTTRAVELRKGPGKDFEIVDSLPPGYALEGSLTTDRLWLRVKPGAFAPVEAVQLQETAAAAAAFHSFWVGPHVANIREFPLTSARILRKADPGAELKLQIFNAEWATVNGGGFVFRKLMTGEAPQVLQLPAVMRVTVEKAEIRSGPGPQYSILGLYFRNHKVEAQELQSGWLRVGQDQYIRAQEMELAVKPGADKTM